MAEDITYDLDNLPEDAEVFVGQTKEFTPIDPSEIYQVEVTKTELRQNPFYKPDEADPKKRGSKYQFNFEFVIISDGEFYGRRLWDNATPSFKPAGARDATKLYKIVSKILKKEMDLEECFEYAPDMKTFISNLQKDVIGKQLRVAIENATNPKTGKIRTKVSTYNPTKVTLPRFDAEKAKVALANSSKAETKAIKSEDEIEDVDFDKLFSDNAPKNETEKTQKEQKKEESDEIPF